MAYKNPKLIHGNNAKIDPNKHVSELYEANMVTLSNRKSHETPLVDDANVEYAREFVEKNKK